MHHFLANYLCKKQMKIIVKLWLVNKCNCILIEKWFKEMKIKTRIQNFILECKWSKIFVIHVDRPKLYAPASFSEAE